METLELKKTCETCLFMATHEKCDGCLHGGKPYPWPDEYEYANYQEGNWLKRMYQWQIDGKQNIVIGGQGEAEVNTKRTPQETSKNLHYVAEQCGYSVGTLTTKKCQKTLFITTHEGHWRIVWFNDQLERIEKWNRQYDWYNEKDISEYIENYWDRQFIENTVFAMKD